MKIIVILLCLILFIITLSNMYIYYGIRRPPGEKGVKGIKGDSGPMGEYGLRGDIGVSGLRGLKGIKGKDIGLKGMTGKDGIKGFKGDVGEEGKKGVQGDKGIKGNPGLQGDIGFNGKRGMEGPQGRSRIINNLDPINLIADRNKCVRIDAYNKNGDGILKDLEMIKELKCPKNMVVFDIRAEKVSDRTTNSNINNIICCNVVMEPLYGNYYNKNKLLEKMSVNLGTLKAQIAAYKSTYVPNNMWHEYLKEYNEDELSVISYNVEKITLLISGIQSFKSVREIPLETITKYYGNEEEAMEIKEYSEDDIKKITEMSDSITSYEYYLLNLILGLFKSRAVDMAAPIDTTDYKRFIKEVYDFPKNDIETLEETVNYLN